MGTSIFLQGINQDTVIKGNNSSRIPELDGLRGIAILLVISFHYVNNQLIHTPGVPAKVLFSITSMGWIGVDLFFVLSGFLIGSILIREKGSAHYFSTFYIRRIVRIVPNYYLLLVIYFALLYIPSLAENYFLAGNNVLPFWSYLSMLQNIYMAHLRNMGNASLSVTWSIGIEEQFYIIIPFLVYFLKHKWLPVVLLLLITIAPLIRLSYTSWIPTYVLPSCRMDSLSFGVLIAWIQFHYSLKDFVERKYMLLITALRIDIVICAVLFFMYHDLGVVKHTLFALVFSIIILFALALKDRWYCFILRNPVLRWIGSISYSLYLFHYLILGLCHFILSGKKDIGILNTTDILISLVALVFSIVFSWFVYKVLETPMVYVGKKFKYK